MKSAYRFLILLLAGWMVGASLAQATPITLEKPKAQESKYQKPEDMLDMIPFLGELPRSFIFGNGYNMKLSVDSLRIDHMGYRSSRKQQDRDCMIGLSYTTVVAGFFTSRVDLPLAHSATPNPRDWTFSRLGDYTAYFNRNISDGSTFRFVVSAKF